MGVVSSPPAFHQLSKMAGVGVGAAVPMDVAAAFKGKSVLFLKNTKCYSMLEMERSAVEYDLGFFKSLFIYF